METFVGDTMEIAKLSCGNCKSEFDFAVPKGSHLIQTIIGVRLASHEEDPYPSSIRCPNCNKVSKVVKVEKETK